MTDWISIARNLAANQSAYPSVPGAIGQLQDAISALVAGELTDTLIYGANVEDISADKALAAGEAGLQVIRATAPGLAVVLPDATDAGLVAGRPCVIVNPAARDEVQRLTFTGGPSGGTFKLTFDGQETAAISWSGTPETLAANIQAALNALSNLSGIAVEAVSGAIFDVTFGGDDGGADQPLLTLTDNSLTGGTAPNVTIVERWAGFAAGESYQVQDHSGRVLATLAPGERATVRLLSGATEAGEWDVDVMPKFSSTGLALAFAASPAAARQVLQIGGLEDLTPYANADFTIWQRGATALDAGVGGLATSNWANANPHYGPDMWLFQRGSAGVGTVTRQEHTPGQTDVPGARYFARMAITTAGSGNLTVRRRIPGVHRFAGQTIAFGLPIRTNLAGRSVTPKIRQVFGTGGSPSSAVEVDADAVDLEQNAWTLVPAVVAVPSIEGKTLGSNGDDYLELVWDLGEAAVGEWDFSRFILTPGSELGPPIILPPALDEAICGWFLDVIGGDASNQAVGEGLCTATTTALINIHFRPKRAAPTITPSNVAHFQVINGAGSAIASTNITFSQISRRSAVATVTTAGSLTAGQGAILQVSAAGRRLDISAEP